MTTPINEDEQLYSDFDWFAVDDVGHVGHFTSAGFKLLPGSVAGSSELRLVLEHFFRRSAPLTGGYTLHIEVPKPVVKGRTAAESVQSWVAMAQKGLYSFDIETYIEPGIAYFRVASPFRPILLNDLPPDIQSILIRTSARPRNLAESQNIPYSETLDW